MIEQKKLLIFGAGGHGKVCADCANAMGDFKEIAFLDDDYKGRITLGYTVFGGFRDYPQFINYYDEFFVAIGDNKVRMLWLKRLLKKGYKAATLIHPHTIVSNSCEIGAGSIIGPKGVVNAGSILKEGVIVNTGVIVEHDCFIGAGVHLSPGVIIAGNCHIGNSAWICLGAKVSNNIRIGENSIIAGNSFVLKDIGDGLMAAGTPAVIKKSLV